MTAKLLYVDDDPDIRAIVALALELDGHYAVTLAASGPEAIDLVAEGLEPDTIVLDMMMPGMDGLAVMERLRAIVPEGLPILFMTAKGRQADVASYRAQGARGVIVKPFDPLLLGAQIRDIAGGG
jgi:CheY-like chemotaxis protein